MRQSREDQDDGTYSTVQAQRCNQRMFHLFIIMVGFKKTFSYCSTGYCDLLCSFPAEWKIPLSYCSKAINDSQKHMLRAATDHEVTVRGGAVPWELWSIWTYASSSLSGSLQHLEVATYSRSALKWCSTAPGSIYQLNIDSLVNPSFLGI